MALFPSETWVKEYVDKINSSKDYEEAAASWEGPEWTPSAWSRWTATACC